MEMWVPCLRRFLSAICLVLVVAACAPTLKTTTVSSEAAEAERQKQLEMAFSLQAHRTDRCASKEKAISSCFWRSASAASLETVVVLRVGAHAAAARINPTAPRSHRVWRVSLFMNSIRGEAVALALVSPNLQPKFNNGSLIGSSYLQK